MATRNFRELLEARWDEGKFVCVGLDSEFTKIPEVVKNLSGDETDAICDFNTEIIEATKDLVCAYKPNSAFYEACGELGVIALRETIAYIHDVAPGVPVILDAKRGDIGNTNEMYAKAAFEHLDADAITVHPYLGAEAMKPFLDRRDKGIFVLCLTSNPGADEFQGLPLHSNTHIRPIGQMTEFNGTRLYQQVAYSVATAWNANGNCGLVVGATYPEELNDVREKVGDMPILIPGVGAQGGDLEKTVAAGKDKRGRGMIINSSRGIIFASNGPDFADAARRETQKLHYAITKCLTNGGVA